MSTISRHVEGIVRVYEEPGVGVTAIELSDIECYDLLTLLRRLDGIRVSITIEVAEVDIFGKYH